MRVVRVRSVMLRSVMPRSVMLYGMMLYGVADMRSHVTTQLSHGRARAH